MADGRRSLTAAPASHRVPVERPLGRDRSARAAGRVVTEPSVGWGRLPITASVASLGLVAIALANNAGRADLGWADPAFWIGLVVLFGALAVPCVLSSSTRRERIGAIVLLGLGAYFVKVLHSPIGFTFSDEFRHWRTAVEISASGTLFTSNPLSIVGPFYPGLEVVTTALAAITGVSIPAAGVIIIGAARLLLSLTLFLTIEQITRSTRIAAIASLVYTANPNYLFWSAQFGYESLALPLAAFVIYLVARREMFHDRRTALLALASLSIGAVVVTHHLTSYALFAVLAVWGAITWILSRTRGRANTGAPFVLAPLAGALAVAWLFAIAPVTLQYLSAPISGALAGLIGAASQGAGGVKPLFAGEPAFVSPLWERALAFTGVGIIASLLAASLAWIAFRLRTLPLWSNALVWTLVLASLLYVPSQALRLFGASTEISTRSGEFLLFPVGLVIAVGARAAFLWSRRHVGVRMASPPRRRAALPVTMAALIAVAFLGAVVVGMPRWARLPGPYLVTGDTRAIQPESVRVAGWIEATFGPNVAVITDRSNALILATHARADVIEGLSWVFFSPRFESEELDAVVSRGTELIVVDRRMTTMLPLTGHFYEQGEPQAGRHQSPMSEAQLDKFGRSPWLSQILDTGNIVVYAVGLPPPVMPLSIAPTFTSTVSGERH